MRPAYKTVVNIPWFEDEGIQAILGNKVTKESDAYAKVPLVFRALRLRCNTLTKVPVYVFKGKYGRGEPLEGGYAFEDSLPLHDLLWLSEAAILLRGASWVLKNQNMFGYQRGLQWLNPFTVRMEMFRGELRIWQEMPDGKRYPGENQYWTLEDFLYFRDFNPTDDVGPGVSATQVAMQDGNTLFATSRFLSNFFTADALPATMVTMPAGTQQTEVTRVEAWFKKRMRELKERVIGVKGDIKVERLTAELRTFDFDKTDTHAIQSVAWAFDIPKTILTADSANYATAGTEYRAYIEDTIIPRCMFYESIINPFLEESNQRIEFAPEELPVMQEDESKRAQSLSDLTAAGIPLDAALDILGYDLSEEAQASIDKALAEKEKKAKELPKPPVDEEGTPIERPEDKMKGELDKWMRKALNRLKASKSADVEFVSNVIPEEIKLGVTEALKIATTEVQIKAVFKKASEVE
jgi:hypothetical protein